MCLSAAFDHCAHRVSDASGELKFEKLAEGDKVPRQLITEDVCYLSPFAFSIASLVVGY